PELLGIVLGSGAEGRHLVDSPLTDIVCFTGSTEVGRAIAQSCAASLKPAILELGGKDPMIVLEDADLERAAKAANWGGFTNAGQTCVAVERVYVVAAVYEEFLHRIRTETQKLMSDGPPGGPIGPITVDAQADKIREHIRDAESKGAWVEKFGADNHRQLPPALITGVDHSMSIMTNETFGPELAVMSVASEEEAIRKANDSRFGLSAYIFTGSERRGRRVARQLRCGSVAINDVIVQFGFAALPFGGWRDSGLGRLHGREGLLSFSQQQSVVGSRLRLPMELWWYDLGQRSYGVLRKFIRWWYAHG
ncbi:MAG: aldehyde dehydrogenase family protein, partial [Candidatus Neomarinimicrobiota bacterium]